MQACISPCYAVALVVIKESSEEGEAASKFGYLAMGWALAPMVGPLLGGSLDQFFGWRSSFVVFAILGAAGFILAARELKGVPPPRSDNGYLNLLCAASSFVQVLGIYSLHGLLARGVICLFGRSTIGFRRSARGIECEAGLLYGSSSSRVHSGQLPCWSVCIA
jgi:predicted MFS family arabinose efflux permease